MKLTTDRLTLRPPRPTDWPAYHGFMMSDRSRAFPGSHHNLGGAWRSFAAELGHWHMRGYGMWAVTWDRDDQIRALIGPWFPDDWPETEIGWMVLDPSCEGTGLAAEAAEAAIHHAYGSLNWSTVVHYIAPGNHRSIKLAERLGAKLDASAPKIPGAPTHLVYRSPRPQAR